MSNPLKKLLGQTAVYGLTVIVGRALNFLLIPLYTSEAIFNDPKDYGVVSELYAWVAFLIVLLPFGMETAFFKFFHAEEKNKDQIFQTSFLTVIGFNLLFFLVVLFLNQSIADWMLFSDHPGYILFLVGIVCVDAIAALPLAKLRAENKPGRFAMIQFSSIMLMVGLNLLFLLVFFDKSTDDPSNAVTYILLANLLASLFKLVLIYKDFLNIKFTINPALLKQMVWYALPLVFAGFAGIINETLDRILLKRLLYEQNSLEYAAQQVGIYSANYKLAMLVTILLQAYRYAAEPFFFANAKIEDRNKLYVKVMNYFVAFVCLIFIAVSFNLQIFKYFIPNDAYWDGLKVVPILLLANVFLGIYFNQSIWYKLSGQTKFGAFIAIGGALVTIGINLAFIPLYGYMASAWATLIVYGLQMIASYLLGQKYFPIKYNLRKFSLYLGLALLMFFIVQLLNIEEGWMQFVIHNTFILFYIFVVYVIEKPTKKKPIVV